MSAHKHGKTRDLLKNNAVKALENVACLKMNALKAKKCGSLGGECTINTGKGGLPEDECSATCGIVEG